GPAEGGKPRGPGGRPARLREGQPGGFRDATPGRARILAATRPSHGGDAQGQRVSGTRAGPAARDGQAAAAPLVSPHPRGASPEGSGAVAPVACGQRAERDGGTLPGTRCG